MSGKRFRIAFSFAGEKRDFVADVAAILAERFGEDKILYDKFHEAEFARYDLGLYLPKLYGEQSELIVPVLCSDYDQKRWTGWEWLQIYGLLTKADGKRVMPCRFDFAQADGLSPAAGFIELDDRAPGQVATLILERLAMNEGRSKDFYTKKFDDKTTILGLDENSRLCGDDKIVAPSGSLNSEIGENKKIDENNGGRKVRRLLNRKYILPVFIVVLIILALFGWAYLGNEPPHKAELIECVDSANKEVDKTGDIKYVTKAKWWQFGIQSTDTGWKVNESGTPNYRSIEDDKIGLLKCQTNEIYNSYKDFAFEFKAKPMSEGVSWVARAENFENYYLFELVIPQDEIEGIFLTAYVYKNNKKSNTIGYKHFYGRDKPIEFVHVKMNVIDNAFYLCLSIYPPLVSKEMSDPVIFRDKDRTFPLGGIGFASRSRFAMSLGEAHVRPGANFSENHCQ